MGFVAGSKYVGKILSASIIRSSVKQTRGLEIWVEVPDVGEVSDVIWLTQKNRERAAESLKSLGFTDEDLADPSFWAVRVTEELPGIPVRFTATEEIDEFKGKTRRKIRVGWMHKYVEGEADSDDVGSIATLFGGAKSDANDDDIPF